METERAFAGTHCLQPRRIGRAAGILVAEELHIAAELNRGDLPARAVAIVEPGEFGTKADRKGQDPNTAQPRDQEMAELMEKYDQAEDEQKRDDVAGHLSPQRVDMRQKIRPHDVAEIPYLRPCIPAGFASANMPLRQFRARGLRRAFWRYGQYGVPLRPRQAHRSHPGGAPRQGSPPPGPRYHRIPDVH